jgi:solute carrier family 10 (sodium/bile acid cotransporter), member 7
MNIVNWLKGNYFLLGIFIVVLFALIYPQPGIIIEEKGVFLPLTFLAMFLSSLGLPVSKIKNGCKEYKNIIACFILVFLIFPVLAYLIYNLFHLKDSNIYVGVMILAVQSSTLASATILTMAAGGNVPLALIMTITNNVLSAFLSPVILKVFISMDENIIINVQDMITKLGLVLILPIILAQILRYFIKKRLFNIDPFRNTISKGIILMFILAGTSTAVSHLKLRLNILIPIIILIVILHIMMLILASLYARMFKLNRENRTAMLFCSSQKTLPASLMIWSNYFPGYVYAPIIMVAYHIIQLLIDSFLVNILTLQPKK